MISEFLQQHHLGVMLILWLMFLGAAWWGLNLQDKVYRYAQIVRVLLELRRLGRYTERMHPDDVVDYGYADGAQTLIRELDDLLEEENR
jgi:hypothetical protein